MPKISDDRREERRKQILDAAWTCFQRQGLHATTMHDIIDACGLSAGAVYSYFRSKDDLIVEAVTTSLSGLKDILGPLLRRAIPPSPEELVSEVATAIAGFARRDGYDLRRIALLGWSEAQRNDRLLMTMRTYYKAFRDELRHVASSWQQRGILDSSTDQEAVSKTLLSIILGFVVQSAILADVEPKAIATGLGDLTRHLHGRR